MQMLLPHRLLAHCARNFPTKVAYYLRDESRTWAQMHGRSDRLAAALQRLGAGKGRPAALLSKESFEVYEHFFACLKIGAIRLGVNWRYPPAEVLHVLRDSGARLLLVHAECLPALQPIRGELEALGVTLIGYGGSHGLALDYERLLREAEGVAPEEPELHSEDAALYTYTSGTTGKPKGVMLSHGALAAAIYQSVIGRGFLPDDIWYMPAQSSWVAVVLNLAGVVSGMSHVIVDGAFEIGRFLRDMERLGVTVINLGPTLLRRAIEEYKRGRYDLSSLRLLTYGSGPATPELIREAGETFKCDLQQSYGTTEATGGWIAYLYPSDHRYALAHEPELLKSCGRVAPGFEVSVRGPDGRPLPHGVPGEIWVKGPTLMSGYVNLPELTAEVLRDGWLRTNDIGRMDERGYLFLLERKADMIITGGVNVFPSGVEAVLLEHAAVQEAGVVGVPHPEWGEQVVAAVKPRPGVPAPSALELARFCAQRLSKPECPKVFAIVEELPKTDNGKVKRSVLRQWFADSAAAAQGARSRVA